jgi:hypothetical protein
MASLESTVVLPAHFAMERELREQLSVRPGHQRCMEGRNELLLLVHEVPVAGESRRQPLYFWRRSDRCWLEPDGTGLGGLGALLERYARAIGDHEDLLEEADTAAEIFGILRHAGPLARSTRNLLQALNQALTADPDDRAIRGYRDRAVELERAADLLHQDARMTLDFWRAERAEEHSRAAEKVGRIAFRMNLLMGFFLPLMALAGLLGMNVRIPGFLEPLFWGVLAAGIALGGVLLFLAGRGTRNGGDADPDPPA